jgi:hypothetical protein
MLEFALCVVGSGLMVYPDIGVIFHSVLYLLLMCSSVIFLSQVTSVPMLKFVLRLVGSGLIVYPDGVTFRSSVLFLLLMHSCVIFSYT